MAQRNRPTKKAGGSPLSFFYILLAVASLAGVIAIAWAVMGRGGDVATEPVELDGLDDPQALLAAAQGVTLGEANAPVKIIEFGDYQCPGCGYFALQVKPQIVSEYVESGQVQFVYYDFPLTAIHQHAFVAARTARCAGEQDRFWDYHDMLFARQSEWANQQNAVDDFIEYGETLGLDAEAFEACVRSDQFADVVSANARLGEQLMVNSTPTVIVNSRRVTSPTDYGAVRAAIEEALGR